MEITYVKNSLSVPLEVISPYFFDGRRTVAPGENARLIFDRWGDSEGGMEIKVTDTDGVTTLETFKYNCVSGRPMLS